METPQTPGGGGATLVAWFPPGDAWPDTILDNWPRFLELTEGKSFRLDRALVYAALAVTESNGREDAVGDGGEAIGLFQLHARGAGAGMTIEERKDPEAQYRRFIPAIDKAFDQAVAEGHRGKEIAVRTGQLAERPYDDPNNPYDGPYQYGKTYTRLLSDVEWAHRLEL